MNNDASLKCKLFFNLIFLSLQMWRETKACSCMYMFNKQVSIGGQEESSLLLLWSNINNRSVNNPVTFLSVSYKPFQCLIFNCRSKHSSVLSEHQSKYLNQSIDSNDKLTLAKDQFLQFFKYLNQSTDINEQTDFFSHNKIIHVQGLATKRDFPQQVTTHLSYLTRMLATEQLKNTFNLPKKCSGASGPCVGLSVLQLKTTVCVVFKNKHWPSSQLCHSVCDS